MGKENDHNLILVDPRQSLLICLPDGTAVGAHPMSPAGGGGAGRFTSRQPAGLSTVMPYHPQTGVVDAPNKDGWYELLKKDLDGVMCILEARDRLILYLAQAVKDECNYDVEAMGKALIAGLQDMLSFLAKSTLIGAVIGGAGGIFAG